MYYVHIFPDFHEYDRDLCSRAWCSDTKLSQRFSKYATHKSFTLTWARIYMKLGVDRLKSEFTRSPTNPSCVWSAQPSSKGRFRMAAGFVMDALHSCNDEWVRRAKNEWSVGGGNIHRACHGQGRKHRGLRAAAMGKTSRFPGRGSWLFISALTRSH